GICIPGGKGATGEAECESAVGLRLGAARPAGWSTAAVALQPGGCAVGQAMLGGASRLPPPPVGSLQTPVGVLRCEHASLEARGAPKSSTLSQLRYSLEAARSSAAVMPGAALIRGSILCDLLGFAAEQ